MNPGAHGACASRKLPENAAALKSSKSAAIVAFVLKAGVELSSVAVAVMSTYSEPPGNRVGQFGEPEILHCAFSRAVSAAVAGAGANTVSTRSTVAPLGWMPFAVMRNSAFAG